MPTGRPTIFTRSKKLHSRGLRCRISLYIELNKDTEIANLPLYGGNPQNLVESVLIVYGCLSSISAYIGLSAPNSPIHG